MGESAAVLRQQVLDWLTDNVPAPRVEHVLRVEQMAIELAQRHGLDSVKAAQAGLMHDLAKYFKPQVLLEIARQEHLALDSVDEMNPHLLHADVSAVVARDRFGITEPDILAAIANHTLGQPGMDALSCIVYLADGLEPGRGQTAELAKLRQISHQNLAQAVWMTSDYTLHHLITTQRLIHPRAIATRNWFLDQARQCSSAQNSETYSESSRKHNRAAHRKFV